VKEGPRGQWLRGMAAVMAAAAGVIHLAQIGPHLEEGWAFAGFFLIVGSIQVVAAALLVRPRPAAWLGAGLVGSGAVIVIWVVTRTAGLPFGPEPGEAEALGAADAAASLVEAITVVVLALWLRDHARQSGRIGDAAAILTVAGLGALWSAGRVTGVFDPDPRATIGLPQLIDRAALAVVAAVALTLVLMAAFTSVRPRWWAPLMRGLLGALFIASAVLSGLTLPAAGGQNASCNYAPLAERSLLSHDPPPAASLAPGDERWLPVLVLDACGRDAVQIESVDVLMSRGPGTVLEFALLAAGDQLSTAGAGSLPSGAESPEQGPVVEPGAERQLVIRLRAGTGGFNLDSVRISYLIGAARGEVSFAAVLATCLPARCEEE
jgi:hypothetical protein